MMRVRTHTFAAAIAFFLLSSSAVLAQTWYDSYADGVAAAKKQNWPVVIQKMNDAISKKSSEGRKEKTYGTIFIGYFPYYYRGVAYFETGDFDKALKDLEHTMGSDPNLGTTESYIRRAKEKSGFDVVVEPNRPPTPPPATPTPTPTPTPIPPPTRTPTPAIPTFTPTPPPVVRPDQNPPGPLDTSTTEKRRRALQAVGEAAGIMNSARREQADILAAARYDAALRAYSDATNRANAARTLADWQRVLDSAEGAKTAFNIAISDAQHAKATESVTSLLKRRVRSALDDYFAGKYQEAAAQFDTLANSQQDNALLWAFLGASRYAQYYIEGETNAIARTQAEDAFRRAKRGALSTLPAEYFSPRIRRFYESIH